MANQEHLEILSRGVDSWNKWREDNSDIIPNLIGAHLTGENLSGINLRKAELRGVDLRNAILQNADLRGIDLMKYASYNYPKTIPPKSWIENLFTRKKYPPPPSSLPRPYALFEYANLRNTNLSNTDLRTLSFRHVDLHSANLFNADLNFVDFNNAVLREADLRRSNLIEGRLRGTDLCDANITGTNLFNTDCNSWRIDRVKCDYVYFDPEGKKRTPEDRNFEPGEFERLYKWRPLNDFERLIERSIEFPPEYKQAGASILNYFSEILRKKYPESEATVQIKQDGLKVTMTIDPANGEREVIEKTLNDYGLVITGQMPPEQFTNDKFLVYELKNELRIAQHRIESQRELLQITKQGYSQRIESIEEQVCWLRNTVGTAIQSYPVNEVRVNVVGGDVKESTVISGDDNKIK